MRRLLARREAVWAAWVVGALLLLAFAPPTVYGLVVPLSALVLALLPGTVPRSARSVDRQDLVTIGGLYLAVVVLYRLAFGYFTVDSVVGLFLCFAGGMILGVVGPIIYTVWRATGPCGRSASGSTTGGRPRRSGSFSPPCSSCSRSTATTFRRRSTGFLCW